MSTAEIESGKRKVVEIVRRDTRAVQVLFKPPVQGYYNVLFVGRRSTSRTIAEDELADLANNGGRLADITLRIREALNEIGELDRATLD